MKYLKPGTVVVVTWQDASGSSGWHDEQDLHNRHTKPYMVKTLGEVCHHDKRGLTLTHGHSNNGFSHGAHHTPASYIKRIAVMTRKSVTRFK